MQRNFKLGLAVAAVASLALTLAGAASASESSHGNLTVVEEALTDTETPVNTDLAGDVLVFHNELFNKTDTKHVGSDRGDCTRINPTEFGTLPDGTKLGTWECRWTNFLPGGQITVEGPFDDVHDTVVSITGGTGVYSQARGQMLLQSVLVGTDQDYNFVFQFGQKGD